MGTISQITHNNENFKLEEISESEIKEIASIGKGDYNSQPGRYFILTTKDNPFTCMELIKNNSRNKYFIGQAGVIVKDMFSKQRKIIHGPELVDLFIAPQYRMKGLAQLLTLERLKYLNKEGLKKAYFIDNNNSVMIGILNKLKEKNNIDYTMNKIDTLQYLYEINILNV